MARGQRGELNATQKEERVRGRQERIGFVLDQCREGALDLTTISRLNEIDLQAVSRGRNVNPM
jgi:hypothetical protein